MCFLALVYSRSLAAQQRARTKEVLAQNKTMQTTMAIGRKAIQVGSVIYCIRPTYLALTVVLPLAMEAHRTVQLVQSERSLVRYNHVVCPLVLVFVFLTFSFHQVPF